MTNKKIFKITKLIITIFILILFNLFIIHEDNSWLFIPFLYSGISFILLLITENIANKIIEYGDNLKTKLHKFLYYFILFPFFIIIGLLAIAFIFNIFSNKIADLGQALLFLFLTIVMLIALIIPYINILLFLMIRLILKTKKN